MRRIASNLALMFLVLAGTMAQAATPEDVIKYRQAVMETMAGHMVAITMIFGGQIDAQSHLAGHVDAVAAASTELAHMFPAGSDVGKTDALPLIWQEGNRFEEASEAAVQATTQLREAVDSGERAAIGRAIKATGDSCKGCHDRYRQKD